MALKTYNPTTPGRRNLVLVDRSGLWKGDPVKKLTKGLSQQGGRNSNGRITARRRGGGHKRRYRIVDFRRQKFDVPAKVVDVKPGNAMPLANIPVGTIVHNVEMKAGRGGQIARAAGTYVQLVGRDAGYALLRLSSGEVRMVRAECMATIGAVSNPDQANIKLGKAGRKRWLGKRPSVRGVAMNRPRGRARAPTRRRTP
jgi:large subunit ribosomal protein L2